jgi:nuclear cap-binding protein subunit 2
LSFYTKEEELWELFYKIGLIKRIIMGLHRYEFTPCGFCFIEFYNFSDAKLSFFFFSGIKLNERFLKIDFDEGFENGRQYGRGKQGGQIQDEEDKHKKRPSSINSFFKPKEKKKKKNF